VVPAFWYVASGSRRFDFIVMGKLEQVETVMFYVTLEEEDYARPHSAIKRSYYVTASRVRRLQWGLQVLA
jgi:hypothetical protein